MRTIRDYEIVDHGIYHPDYFQGCGVSFTEYTDVATGIGDNPYDALEDALESIAQMGYDTESNQELNEELESLRLQHEDKNYIGIADDMYYYLSIRVK